MKSKLTLQIEGGACSDLLAWEMNLEEGLGRAYRAVLTAASERVRTPADLRSQALGKRVVVKIEQFFEDGIVTRYLDGLVTGVRHEGPASMRPDWLASFGSERPKGSLYAFVIEPLLVNLRYARRTCDYPDTTPLKAALAVLARHNVPAVVDDAYLAQEKYSGKVRFVQQDETDWDFFHRLLARYGLSYSFVHADSGSERLYLSDGQGYPPTSPLEFSNLTGYADGPTLNFSCVKQVPGSFPMKTFVAESGLGVDRVKNRFVRPADSRMLEKAFGPEDGTHQWLLSDAPAGYGENVDDAAVDGDFQRATDALSARLRLARDDWRGETASVAAMPGKVISLSGFLDASGEADSPVKAKVTRTQLTVRLGDEAEENFHVRFAAMDFADDAEKRFVPPAPPERAAARPFEAFVCDRGGRWNEQGTKNTIVVSPHSTPETPWIFLVANPNGGEGAVMDVAMTMPLGGRRQGLYRFPRVGERVLVANLGDRLVLAGYVPDRATSPGDFPDAGDPWTRQATALRSMPPVGPLNGYGAYDEVGFSFWNDAVEQLQQRIVDGTCYQFLRMEALAQNNLELYNSAQNDDGPRIFETRKAYFAQPGKDTAEDVRTLAKQLVEKYRIASEPSTAFRMRSSGRIVQFAQGGIELTTPGELRINASAVTINGTAAVNLQSMGLVRSSVNASSATVNADGVVARSGRLLDAPGEYDSSVIVGAADGVSVNGANVRMNGLFTTTLADALGGGVVATNGELRISGAAVDLATVGREQATQAFSKLNETSGLNGLKTTLESWKAGKTPDDAPRSVVDRSVGFLGLSGQGSKTGSVPPGCFRGTLSGVTQSAGNKSDLDGSAGVKAGLRFEACEGLAGANRNLTISERELLRTKAFVEQMDTHRKTLESVVNSVVDGKASSVTIHGHQLDINVQVLKDLSETHNADGAPGSGGI